MNAPTLFDPYPPTHTAPTTSVTEHEGAIRATYTVSDDRKAVLNEIRRAGRYGIVIRDIQNALYSFVGIRTQHEGHQIASKVNKVATRCLELETEGLIRCEYDDQGDRVVDYSRDGVYGERRFLKYWVTPKGFTWPN